jgi:DNA repair protein RecO
MRQVVTRGIILARTDFSEADRILTILTVDQGKIRAIAKAVRKVKSKLAGGIELFSVSQISFIRGKSDIFTLTSTRLEKHYGHIVNDLDRTMYAYDVLKTINRITEDNADSDYFYLLNSALEALDNLNLKLPLVQLWLNLQLLKLAGHSPNLRTDNSGRSLKVDAKYNFDLERMAFAINPKGMFDQRHIKFIRLAFGQESPESLIKIIDYDSILPGCLQLTKAMLKQVS